MSKKDRKLLKLCTKGFCGVFHLSFFHLKIDDFISTWRCMKLKVSLSDKDNYFY